ncbi:hypothetical protein CH373_08510 [Leptospira perolatii]|uniref:Uncharacterized protein n=1 Tax=Leptospira perolatii TaxID=2023191 RepID=A0A2M9ZNJ0_9LEPT|nr:hypothetical protein CH360_15005 [Leptospira perolatii]PJZ73539.1 hypothetical protein CH373_08510 [Leptospira perolatii]
MDDSGVLKPRKYFIGASVLTLFCTGWYFIAPNPILGFWKGVLVSLLISFCYSGIRLYILQKHSKDGLSAQFGTTVLFFFAQAVCLATFLWGGEGQGFVIGFFIAHFANLLILVFAR